MQQYFICDTHVCKSHSLCILAEGWQAKFVVYKELPQAFFSISALAVERKFCNV